MAKLKPKIKEKLVPIQVKVSEAFWHPILEEIYRLNLSQKEAIMHGMKLFMMEANPERAKKLGYNND